MRSSLAAIIPPEPCRASVHPDAAAARRYWQQATTCEAEQLPLELMSPAGVSQ